MTVQETHLWLQGFRHARDGHPTWVRGKQGWTPSLDFNTHAGGCWLCGFFSFARDSDPARTEHAVAKALEQRHCI